MPLLKQYYTSEDYWSLKDGERAELIDGRFYNMTPPNRIHQKLITKLTATIDRYISEHNGDCEVYPAPFAVNLDANDKNWVEPDISVICDPNKLTDRGCAGSPDLIFEIVSSSSRKMDYSVKNALYSENGVREYWIVDPAKERVTVYYYEEDAAPTIYSFSQDIKVCIYDGLSINIQKLLEK